MRTDRAAILIGGAMERALRKQARLLELRPKVGSLGGVENHIAQQVVPPRAVPTAAAY